MHGDTSDPVMGFGGDGFKVARSRPGDYITRHELPFLLRQAERGALKLGTLHVSAVAKAALAIHVEIDGQTRTVNLADIIGVNSPAEPFDRMSPGERNALYVRAADWAHPANRPFGDRLADSSL